jgi:hypothetical protein
LKRKKQRNPNKVKTRKRIIATFENTTIGYDPNQNAVTGKHLNCSKGLKIENDIKCL